MNLLLLSTSASTAAGGDSTLSMIMNYGFLALIFVVFYFFLIRPQRKRQKQETEMRKSLQVGDEVTTIGGIIGRVVSIKDDTILIETGSDRAKIRLKTAAVASVVPVKMDE